MKLNKLIFGAVAMIFCSGAFAQTVTFHAGIDYTTWALSQTRLKTKSVNSKTDPSAGYDPDGNMTVDVAVRAANFEFNLGLYFNADGGDNEYYDFSDDVDTAFYQGNMKVSFLNEQTALYLGKFEDFNADFIEPGYALGDQYITNLADKDHGQYLTGLMITPMALSSLRFFVGFPILPTHGNGIPDSDRKFDQWNILYKKAKIAASYQLPNDMTINVGYRPGTYFDGVDAYAKKTADRGEMAALTDNFTESLYGEGFLQLSAPSIIDGVDANLSYDIRYRDEEYATYSATKEHTTFAHMIGLSAEFGSLISDSLSLAVEDRFFYADDDYIKADEKLIYDIFAVSAEVALAGQPFSVGLNAAGMFACDALGTAFANDGGAKIKTGRYYCDDSIGMSLNDMATASLSGIYGNPSTYIGAYVNPYVKFNMSNGAVIVGAEICYTNFSNDNVTNTGLSYRIPVGLKFVF